MAKTKKPKPQSDAAMPQNDIDTLKSDVASLVSSLGFSSSLPAAGFDDTDFRKTGKIKQTNPKPVEDRPKPTIQPKPSSKPVPKAPALVLREGGNKGYEKFNNLPRLPLCKASGLGVWYNDAMELEKRVFGGEMKMEVRMSVEEWKRVVERKREIGERLLWQYGKDYEESRGKSGDIKMVVAAQRSGTAADKVSAFSVVVGDNCVANLRSLDALLGMVTSKVGKRHALTGFEALKELFISSLLSDRKLKTLLQRPVDKLPETKDGYSLLLFWYWEECVKQRYVRFVAALEDASRDTLPVLKDKALKAIFVLLKSKSELERRLLSALVNKLGDPQNKSASNADFHLSNLLSEHPNMKAVVIDEVDTFLFRPHLGLQAKYHAVNFLSQIRLSHKGDGPKVARRLIDVYFALFKVLITEAEDSQKMDEGKAGKKRNSGPSKETKEEGSSESHIELDSRLLSALLTGVNRAFPYVSSIEADDIVEVHTPMLFQLVHSKNFNVGIQALMLLDKISSKNQVVSDRFYRALYSKLLVPSAMNSSKAEMFIGLLLRAMKNDVHLKRVSAFSKRLLQVALQQPAQFACGCLFLLSEVLKARPPLWNMVLQNESVDDDIEHFEDIIEENDDRHPTVYEKEERTFEASQSNNNNNNNNKTEPKSESSENENNSSEDEEDDEEDNPVSGSDDDSDEDDDLEEDDQILMKDDSKKVAQESQSLSNNHSKKPQVSSSASSLPGGYDPRHREPSFCNAERTSWWELMVLASHAHPSVATMAGTLLSGANIVYNGNPLNDLALPAFLDKFMEKKPKQTTWHGGSQIEPAKQLDMNNHLIGTEILSLAEMDVPPEDFVFHKFYLNKMNTSKIKKKKKRKHTAEEEDAEELLDGDEAVEGDDDSDNEEINNLLDSADMSAEEYDYGDLDKVANEDDDDLVGDASDGEMDAFSDVDEEEENDFDSVRKNNAESDSDDREHISIGDADDGIADNEGVSDKRKRKRKSGGKTGASPFASLEDYEHLINEEETPTEQKSKKKKRPKSEKKKKSSK